MYSRLIPFGDKFPGLYKLFHEGKELEKFATDKDGNIWRIVLDRFADMIQSCHVKNSRIQGYRKFGASEFGRNGLLTHRVICETFHGPSDGVRTIVNHKDGNKLNNHPDNLEWCTYSENSTHAYKSGLRKDNRPVRVMDLIENKETKYHSLWEAARDLGIDGSLLHYWLNGESKYKRTIQRGRYLVAYGDDPYPEYDENDIGKRSKYEARPIKVTNLKTNEVKYYFDIISSYMDTKPPVKSDSLRMALMRNKGNTVYGDFRYEYLPDDFDPESVDVIKLTTRKKRKLEMPLRPPKPIEVYNTITGVKKTYRSTQDFADEHGVKKNTVQKAMWEQDGRYHQFIIKYLDIKQ